MKKILLSVNVRALLFAFIIVGISVSSEAQVIINTIGSPYSQDFNSLAGPDTTWKDDSTLVGWYAMGSTNSMITSFIISKGSSSTGALYSLGKDGTSERALGGLTTNADPYKTIYFGVRIKNNTGVTISSLSISFKGEQWRRNNNQRTLSFRYSTNATALSNGVWTADTSLDFTGPITGNGTYVDGNADSASRIISSTLPVSIPNNTEIWLRWQMSGGSSPALGIDDLSVTANEAEKYYSKSTGYLNDVNTWGSNTDGTGTSPANFSGGNILYVITNNSNATINGNWTVSGSGSKVRVGTGVDSVNFTVPASFSFGGIVEVSDYGNLILENTTLPDFGLLSQNSTVTFASNSTQNIPGGIYGNIVSAGTGNRILDSTYVVNIQGSFTPGSNSYTNTNSTVGFIGSAAQTIPSFNFNNLRINNSAGVSLNGTVQFSNLLTTTTLLTVNGTLINTGNQNNVTDSTTLYFKAGSKYSHITTNGGFIVLAKWDSTAVCEVISNPGVSSNNYPKNVGGQNFGIFKWNSPSQAFAVNLSLTSSDIVKFYKLIVENTGANSLRLSATNSPTIYVSNSLEVNGGALQINTSSGAPVLNIDGNIIVSGGELDLKSAGSSGNVVINLMGNIIVTDSGSLKQTASNINAATTLNLIGSNTLNLSIPTKMDLSKVNLYVAAGKTVNLLNGYSQIVSRVTNIKGVLNAGTNVISGQGSVVVESGGEFQSGSTNPSGAIKGNISTSGGYSFLPGSTVTFNGSALQYVTTNNFHSLNLNNASGLQFVGGAAIYLSGDLTLTAGVLNVNTGIISVDGMINRNGTSSNGQINATNGRIRINGSSVKSINTGTIINPVKRLTIENLTGVIFSDALQITDSLILKKGFFVSNNFSMANNSSLEIVDGTLASAPTYGTNNKIVFTGTNNTLSGLEIQPLAGVPAQLIARGTGEYNVETNATINTVTVEATGNLDVQNKVLTVSSAPTVSGILSTAHLGGLAGSFVAAGPGSVTPLISTSSTINYTDTTGTQTVDSLNFGNINFSGKNKNIIGNISVAGNASSTGASLNMPTMVSFIGDTVQSISLPAASFKNITISGNGNKTIYAVSSLTNRISFGTGTATVDFGNNLFTLLSSSSGTASIGDVKNYTITGNIEVQNYVAGGRRAFRFLAHPFSTTKDLSILTSEIDITGTGGSVNGFTPTNTNNPSAFKYDNNSGWVEFTNTTGPAPNDWKPGEGIRVMIRGAKGEGLTGGSYTPSPVVLARNGSVNYGNFTWNLTKGSFSGFNMIGNPYPSPLNLKDVFVNPNVSGSAYYVWNPRKQTFGAYELKFFNSDYALPIGASIIVEMSGNADISVTESLKVAEDTAVVYQNAPMNNMLHLVLELNGSEWADFYVFDKAGASASKDHFDNLLMSGTNTDIYTISSDSLLLSIDCRPINGSTVIPVGINTANNNNFSFYVDEFTLNDSLTAVLFDSVTGISTPLIKGNTYSFTMDQVTGLSTDTRFKILFSSNRTLPVNSLDISAVVQKQTVLVSWKNDEEVNTDHYELQHLKEGKFVEIYSSKKSDKAGVHVYSYQHQQPLPGQNAYRIKMVNKDGEVKYSKTATVYFGVEKQSFSVFPNPVEGGMIKLVVDNMSSDVYQYRLISSSGAIVKEGSIHVSGSATPTINVGKTVSAGMYQLILKSPSNQWVQKVLIK